MSALPCPSSRACSRRSGLTLIELLIVAGILVFVVAVPYSYFAHAREKARRSSCQSNLKQIGLGMLQYARDYDERFPPASNGSPRLVWQLLLQPYVKSISIFMCPSNSRAWEKPLVSPSSGDVSKAFGSFRSGYLEDVPRSYGLNVRVSVGSLFQSGKSSDLARKIMVAESIAPWPDYGSPWWNGRGWSQGFAGHLSTSNYLFVDGHVEAMRPRDTAAPWNMWGGMKDGACTSPSLWCNTPEPAIISGLSVF